jgi:hypothetical protein
LPPRAKKKAAKLLLLSRDDRRRRKLASTANRSPQRGKEFLEVSIGELVDPIARKSYIHRAEQKTQERLICRLTSRSGETLRLPQMPLTCYRQTATFDM